jgi:hypothetical protein
MSQRNKKKKEKRQNQSADKKKHQRRGESQRSDLMDLIRNHRNFARLANKEEKIPASEMKTSVDQIRIDIPFRGVMTTLAQLLGYADSSGLAYHMRKASPQSTIASGQTGTPSDEGEEYTEDEQDWLEAEAERTGVPAVILAAANIRPGYSDTLTGPRQKEASGAITKANQEPQPEKPIV